jgi:hypothetical protein
MAYLKQPKSEEEIKKLTLTGLKKAYIELSKDYTRLLDGDYIYCGKCNSFLSRDAFYSSSDYASGKFPVCKKCLMLMATDYDKKTNTYTDNKEKTKETLKFLDLPFIESTYNSALSSVQAEVNERNRGTAWQQYITMVQSLPNWKGMRWNDSEFDFDDISENEEIKFNQKTIKNGKKRFGNGYSNEDYMFLESEYQDWTTRYACENKAQELLFKRICCKELEIDKAQKLGKDTKELDKTLQDLMGSLSVKPSQSNSDSLADFQTFGQLIAKWEDEKPIPEPDEEFRDVDKIGLYIDVFFKGHLSKMMGLKNAFSSLYERFIRKYTVTKPQYDEDIDSEVLFDQIFGSKIDEE